mmetsp:Transcript_42037/g.101202  ORF Transcript_42037/g.101202 Transcript_42037/m.101202 type:complete len:224 (+) Transcript_42037:941-1612(+)
MAGLRGKRTQRAASRNTTWPVDAIIGARIGRTGREYLVRWEMEIEPGEKWETWEPYGELLVEGEGGEMEIYAANDEQVARLDTLTPEEELSLLELDQRTLEAETCPLQAADRVLHDRGEGLGFCAGRVLRIDASGRFVIKLDGEREEKILARDDCLFKAPEPTQLKKNAVVRVAFDDTAIEGTMRWQYGKVVKVFTGGELVDINLDSGEELRATPTFDVDAVQ